MGPHQADVEVDVLGERGGHHALGQRLDEEVLGLLPEVAPGLLGPGAAATQELVAHVERGVGPGALGQVADDRRDPVVAGDEEHVALADVAAQGVEIVPAALLVAGQRLDEEREKAFVQPAAESHPSLFVAGRGELRSPEGNKNPENP